jgi:hypothetical protein
MNFPPKKLPMSKPQVQVEESAVVSMKIGTREAKEVEAEMEALRGWFHAANYGCGIVCKQEDAYAFLVWEKEGLPRVREKIESRGIYDVYLDKANTAAGLRPKKS